MDLNLYSIGNDLEMLADKFESFVEKSASGVSGDVVVSALHYIKKARLLASEIHRADAMYRITEKPVDKST